MSSLPYSITASRQYGNRVCDVLVTVKGPCDRLQEVQIAFSGMRNFSTLYCCCDKTTELSYDADNDSDTSTDSVCVRVSPNTSLHYDSSPTLSPQSHVTKLELVTPKKNDLSTPTDSDSTPIVTPPPHVMQLKLVTPKKNDVSTPTDSDSTPVVPPPDFEQIDSHQDFVPVRQVRRPKKLFTTEN